MNSLKTKWDVIIYILKLVIILSGILTTLFINYIRLRNDINACSKLEGTYDLIIGCDLSNQQERK